MCNLVVIYHSLPVWPLATLSCLPIPLMHIAFGTCSHTHTRDTLLSFYTRIMDLDMANLVATTLSAGTSVRSGVWSKLASWKLSMKSGKLMGQTDR